MDKTKSQLTWRNLLNTKEQSTQTISVNITFDQEAEVDVEALKAVVFHALTKHAQACYFEEIETDTERPKPTVIVVE